MNTQVDQSERGARGERGGRARALAELDRILAKSENQKAMMTALEKELRANPFRFFRTVVMPLLPRDATLAVDGQGLVQWRSLLNGDTNGNANRASRERPT